MKFYCRSLVITDIPKYPCVSVCAPPDNVISDTTVIYDTDTLTTTFECNHNNSDLVAGNVIREKKLKASCMVSVGKMPYWKFDDYEIKVSLFQT